MRKFLIVISLLFSIVAHSQSIRVGSPESGTSLTTAQETKLTNLPTDQNTINSNIESRTALNDAKVSDTNDDLGNHTATEPLKMVGNDIDLTGGAGGTSGKIKFNLGSSEIRNIVMLTNGELTHVALPSSSGTETGERTYRTITAGVIQVADLNYNDAGNVVTNEFTGTTELSLGAGVTTTKQAYFDKLGTGTLTIKADVGYTLKGNGMLNNITTEIAANQHLVCSATDQTNISLETLGGTTYRVDSTCDIVSSSLSHPNDSNANSELINGMAFSFPPDESNNVVSTANVVNALYGTATISSVANTDNGYGKSYVGSTTSNATGGADRVGITFNVPTTGTVKIVFDYRMTVGTEGRIRIISGGTGFTNYTDLANTNWQGDIKESIVAVDGSGVIHIQIYGEGNTNGNVGDTMEFIISAEAQ
ncbi:hypothetical protein [Maribacter sp.]|uniref:hypothetical protein n=1 Tax=Maribacter sp. TaxID=1897614 RepID=UPI0025BDD030|nr:hypothetical protein [Maribacter sp.]